MSGFIDFLAQKKDIEDHYLLDGTIVKGKILHATSDTIKFTIIEGRDKGFTFVLHYTQLGSVVGAPREAGT